MCRVRTYESGEEVVHIYHSRPRTELCKNSPPRRLSESEVPAGTRFFPIYQSEPPVDTVIQFLLDGRDKPS